jgi:hypothetical protein
MKTIRQYTQEMNTLKALYEALIIEEEFNWWLADLSGEYGYATWFSAQMSDLLEDYSALEIELTWAVRLAEYEAAAKVA